MGNEINWSMLDLVIVTGAGRGIGRMIALEFGRLGTTVLCISKSARSRDTADLIRRNGGKSDWISTDLAEYELSGQSVSAWLRGKEFSRIGLVLAAAILGPAGPLKDAFLTQWDEAFRANFLGNLAVVQAALPMMLQNKFGRLLFFAGGGAAYAYPVFPAYAASKAALVRAVENLHADLNDSGDFAVAILAPGAVETDTLERVRRHGGYVRTTVPMNEPVEFARQFLTSKVCRFSGCFVHVRDDWQKLLTGEHSLAAKDLWKLRRVE